MQITLNKLTILPLICLSLFGCGPKDEAETQIEQTKTDPEVFKLVPSAQSGVTFRNDVDENYENFFDVFAYVYNGAGVGIGDINNDGLPDLYFTGNEVPNKLYVNEGNLKFRDISESAGVQGNGKWNNGVTMADVNGDGLLDIYVCKGGWRETPGQRKNLLYINQGNLTFRDEAASYGLDDSNYSLHASFFDMDNDNDLDVYITNRPDSFDLPLSQMVRQKVLSPTNSRDRLYRNDGGKFKEIGAKAGISNNFGYALSVVTSDLNNDGFTDIFVANDFAEGDYMYINQKNGTFKEQIKNTTNHISMYSMGTDVADINNDGLEDIMVSEMLPENYQRSKVSMPSMDVEGFQAIVKGGMHKQYMHNALHLNQGNSFFSEISQFSGVAKTEWSWATLMSDFDNDGNRDIFVANGYRRDVFDGDVREKLGVFVDRNRSRFTSAADMLQNGFKEFIEVYDPIKVTNYVFRNQGELSFQNVSEQWGFHEPSFSNGAAIGDLDNDGDLELVVNNLDDEAFIYENTSADRNNYLKVRLTGPHGNSSGIGAKVTVYAPSGSQYFENKTVRGYLSSNDPVVHFGLGKDSRVDSVVVNWNDGKVSRTGQMKANLLAEVKYADALFRSPAASRSVPIFAETTSQLLNAPYQHKENTVDEFKEQILLPHMFSRSGPFISTADVNKDGKDDFFVGGASGEPGVLYVQKDGKFLRQSTAAFVSDRHFEDMGSAFFDADGDGDIDLYVVSGGSEFEEGSALYQDRLYLNDGNGSFSAGTLPKTISSGSCVVPFDVDGDGDLDLFRGGQVVAGSYPKSPRSYVLINDKGKFSDKTLTVAPGLYEVGMVQSAIRANLRSDATAQLVIVGEWMAIRIFEFRNGKLSDVSADFGLTKTEGWWNKVIADDLDGDGDQDLLLGNIGENYKFKATADKPFQVYAKDFDGNGTNDIFLARYYKDSLLVPIRGKECTSQQMPGIGKKFPTYSSFARSDLPAILGHDIENAMHYKAHLFSSILLINEGGLLRINKLPVAAQLSAVNGFVVSDFDGDGNKDILLAGNKFDTEVETTPADASPGLLLKGKGNLTFESVKPSESGFFVPYNVKDLQGISINGRMTILVSINNEGLRAFTRTSVTQNNAVALTK